MYRVQGHQYIPVEDGCYLDGPDMVFFASDRNLQSGAEVDEPHISAEELLEGEKSKSLFVLIYANMLQ